jgi:glycosyltransferase involved in cell wall biosynthesis
MDPTPHDQGRPEPGPGRGRPALIFVGAFPPPGSGCYGGNVSDCDALLSSSFPRRVRLLLVDSSEGTEPRTFWQRVVRAGRRAARFARLIHSERPDAALLLASSGFSFVEKSLLVVYARAWGVPSLLSVRSGHFIDECRSSAAFRAMAWILLRAPARLVCQGQRWQELYRTRFGLPVERCPVVDAWVATEELLRVGRERGAGPRQPVTLLYLGALEPAKGLLELLAAFARIHADPTMPEASLVIGGEGSLRAELGQRARDLGLGGAVRFAGLVSGEVKVRCLRDADVFVLASHTEGLPNAMIEAMAAGLPAVVTPVGSIPDVIVHGQNGLMVPVRDPAALERELRRLLTSGELRARLGREAHRVAASRFSPEGAATRLEQLVREVVHGSMPPGLPGSRPERMEGGRSGSGTGQGPN